MIDRLLALMMRDASSSKKRVGRSGSQPGNGQRYGRAIESNLSKHKGEPMWLA